MAFEIIVEDITTIHDETDGEQNNPPNLDATDDDNGNDIAVSSLPPDFSDRLIALGLDPDADGLTDDAIGAAQSGYDGANSGEDVFTITTNGSTVNNLALTDASGDPLDGLDSELDTIDGNSILLYSDSGNDNIVLGIEEGTGDIVFAIYLDENTDLTAGKLWTVQFEAIAHPDSGDGTGGSHDEPLDLADKLYVTASRDLEFDLNNAPSGQNLFIMFGDGNITDGDAEVGMIATGKNPANQSEGESITKGDTVNTSQAGGPTTFGINNQMLTASRIEGEGDGIYFTFVTGPNPDFTVPNLTQTEADVEANMQFNGFLGAKGAEFQVVQLQGGKTAVVKISAYNETAGSASGADFVDELNNDAAVAITSVVVFDADGGGEISAIDGVTIDNGDGTFTIIPAGDTVTIDGVEAGDTIRYFTNGTSGGDHNRVLIENAGDGKGQDSANFDIGGFELIQADSTTAEVGSTVHWEDDGPTIDLTLATDALLQTDDGDLAGGNSGDGIGTDSDSAGVGDLFTVTESAGADGDAGTVYSLVLGTNTTTTLLDAATDEAVVLSDNGGVIEGRTDTSDDLVFTLSVDSATGEVTLTQSRAVEHATTDTAAPYNGDITGLGVSDAVNLSATLTDGDTDTATDSIDISGTLQFTDDGPEIDLTLGAGILQTDDGDLAGGNSGDGIGTDSDSAGVGDLFTVTESAGADGDAGTVYSLVLGTNTTTTLLDAATDEAVVLSDNGGVIEGRTDTSDDLVFTLSVDSATGEVTLTQSRAVEHATTDTAAPYNGDITGLGVSDAVNLSATLTDGDTDTATDSIDISGTLQFTDDGPEIDLTLGAGILQTDDGDLAGGNSGDGIGTDSDSAGVGDLFTVTESAGADGDAGTVYSLVLGTNTTTTLLDAATDEAVVLSDNGGVIEGRTDTSDDLVFTLSVDSATGEVTLTQSRAVEHATTDTAAPYNGDITGLGVSDAVNLSATLTDGDTDTATDSIDISGTLQFTDDGPEIDLTLGAGILQTDDGDLAGGNSGDGIGTDSDSAGVGDLFTVTESAGADGDAGTVYSLVLGTNTTTTLLDAATDEAVVLSDNGGVIEGRTDTSDDLVFTLSVDSATGEVTLTQSRAVEHATTDTAAPYNGDITGLGVSDAVNLSATLTDGDTDTATDSIDISGTLQFTDDGPEIDLTLGAGILQTDDGDLAGGNSGDGIGTDSDSAGVGDLFTVTESAGADGDAGTVYSLVLGTNTTTTLLDAATDEAVVLSDNGGVIEGRTDTSDDLVFTLSVDSATGEVTLTQSRAVEHATTDTAAPYNGDITGLGVSDAVNLSATLTDGDTDTATDSIDISGTLQFTDDGPEIDLTLGAGILQTDDGDLAGGNSGDGIGTDSDSAGVGDLFTVTESAGADGDAGTVYSLVLGASTTTLLVDTATGEAVVLSDNGGVIEGRTDTSDDLVFTLSVDSATGEVTLTQSRAVEHATTDTAAPYNGDITGLGVSDAVNLSATLTDGDTDTATDSIDISGTLQFTDDGPEIDLTLGAGILQTDDGDLAGGNSGDGIGTDSDSAGVGDLFTVTESAGADGDAGTVYSLVLGTNTTTTLLDAATDEAVVLSDNGGVIEGRTDTSDDLVFTLSVDSATGEVTLTQSRAVEHATTDTAAPYNGDITGLGVSDAVNLSATLTDGDTDTATDSIDISGTLQFTDDGPEIDLTLGAGILQTDDGDLAGGNSGDGIGTDSDSAGVGDLFTVTESAGADGDAGTVYSLVLGASTTTLLVDTATGEAVVLSDNGGVIEGRTDTSDDLVFTLSVDSATGEVTLTQSRAVEHATTDTAAPYNGDITGLGVSDAVNLSATLTDGDTDTATDSIDISGTLQFTDDGPEIDLTLGAGILQTDDGDLAGGNSGDGIGTDSDSAGVGDLFTVTESAGADGDAGTVYSLVLGTNTTTTLLDAATDEAVVLSDNGGVIEGRTDTSDDLVFTLSVDSATGEVTLTQSRAVEHATTDTAAPYNGDITGLGVSDAVNLSATLTDGDTDTATDSIDISGTLQFTDDGPEVDFSNLVGTVTTTTQSGFWDESAGADQPGSLTIAVEDTDLVADGIQFDMVTADGTPSTGTVSSFSFDGDTGVGTGTLLADFDNDAGNGDESVNFTLTVNDDGTYDFALDEIPVPVVTLSTDEGQLPAGGPDPVQTLMFGEGADTTDFVFFAVDADTAETGGLYGPANILPAIGLGEGDLTEAQLEAGAAPPIGDGTFPFIREEIEMNVSTTGIGVGNNVFQGYDPLGGTDGAIDPFNPGDLPEFDESFVINPEPLASSVKVFISKTAGGFLPPEEDGVPQEGATAAKTDYLYFNVYDEDGNSIGPILVTSDMVLDEADVAAGGTGEALWSFIVDLDDPTLPDGLTGDFIDAVQFTMGFGDIKIPKIEVVVRGDEPPNDISLDFSATLTDADGDSASTDFAIDLFGNDAEEMFDYTLVDAGPGDDAFNVNVVSDPTSYLVQGFDSGNDELYLLGSAASPTIATGDFGVGDAGIDDSQFVVDGVTVTIEDATLTSDDITSIPAPAAVADADLLLLHDLENINNFENESQMSAGSEPLDLDIEDGELITSDDINSEDTLI